jgi:hypothetical protein
VEAGQRRGGGVDVVAGGLDDLRGRSTGGVPRFTIIDDSRVRFCHSHDEREPRLRAVNELIGDERKKMESSLCCRRCGI